ncbi:MAG: molybdopterin-guanine dinucleotide biosynthesis protein B [Firmicutes bacterium]|nr:molybdopterin-guanine dinucleotide biosynthesis protein B [Bacillota bacterium]
MIPVISVVGKSDSGKTTLLEKIIPELRSRGYRVATVKHDVHGFSLDIPGKDTWRHSQAGADVVIISSPAKMATIRKVERERTLEEITREVTGVDIIITEGYKRQDRPKLEVFRSEKYDSPLCQLEDQLFAIATDNPDFSGLPAVPVIHWDDAAALCDLIEERFLQRTGGE